jgi:hypothetical protein
MRPRWSMGFGKYKRGIWECEYGQSWADCSVMEIADELAPGPHTLSCELLPETSDPKGRREFRLIAVMHD